MIPIIFLYLLQFCTCQMPNVVYVVNIDSQMEACDDISAEFIDTSAVCVERYNETITYMYGDINFLQDVGPDTMVEIILEKEASGKYEIVFSHEICDLCKEVKMGSDSDYYGYIKFFGIPDTCPFPASVYPVKDFTLDTDDLPVNSNTCGRYKATLNLYQNPEKDCKTNKEFMCCLTMNVVIEID